MSTISTTQTIPDSALDKPRTGTWDANRVHGYGGLSFQAAALATYAAQGRTDSPLLSLDETVTILETADEIRRQVGVVYPGEA